MPSKDAEQLWIRWHSILAYCCGNTGPIMEELAEKLPRLAIRTGRLAMITLPSAAPLQCPAHGHYFVPDEDGARCPAEGCGRRLNFRPPEVPEGEAADTFREEIADKARDADHSGGKSGKKRRDKPRKFIKFYPTEKA